MGRHNAAPDYNDEWTRRPTARWLVATQGGVVHPTHGDLGSAPMFSGTVSYPTPDLIWTGGGRTEWCETKGKSVFAPNRAGRPETGYDLARHHDYIKAEQASGFPVRVVFWHRQDNLVLMQYISVLRRVGRENPRAGYGRGGMFYVDRAHLIVIGAYDRMLAAYGQDVVVPAEWKPVVISPPDPPATPPQLDLFRRRR